jgi:hypothetical protein
MIYSRWLKFPPRAVVLLLLESDSACTCLNDHSAKNISLLVLVWCNKDRRGGEQALWGYRLPKGCIKLWFCYPSAYGCLSKKCELRNNEAVTLLYLAHWLLLMSLKSLSILSGSLIINIHCCHQDRKLSWVGPMEYHPHTVFNYSKFRTYLYHDYNRFSNISGLELGGSGYMQVVKWLRC